MSNRLRWQILTFAAGLVAGLAHADAQTPARECRTLPCNKCARVCRATCEADAAVCDAKHKRGCPSAYRACTRGCKSELCAQCMPIQYDGKNRKFMPGKTELCRTPGRKE